MCPGTQRHPHLHPHVCVPAVVPEEVKPKFVKGTKRYGRRSHPDGKTLAAPSHGSEVSPPSGTEAADSSPAGLRRAKLRRSTSLESVEVSGHMFTSVCPCGFCSCCFFFSPLSCCCGNTNGSVGQCDRCDVAALTHLPVSED